MPKRKLAVSDDDTDSDDQGGNGKASMEKGKGKGKGRHYDPSTDEEEVEEVLINKKGVNSNAKTNDKGKKKEMSSNRRRKEKIIEVISDDSDDDGEDDDEVNVTPSEGTLHGSDSEEGMGKWTKRDQEMWQNVEDSDGDYEVDIVIRWRWHPRHHYVQYRVKWEGYSDLYNLWLPVGNFNGDLIEHFWKDLEFAGEGTRPKGWDKKNGKEAEQDPQDTENEILSLDSDRRKIARRRKRKDIRIDRVEMREAYKRKNRREKAERMEREARDEKNIEERRRKRAEEEAKKKEGEGHAKKMVIQVGRQIGKSNVASSSTPRLATASASKGDIDTSSKAAASTLGTDEERRRLLKMYATKPDVVLKAEKKKAREGDHIVSNSGIKQPSTEEARNPPTPTTGQASEQSGPSVASRGGIKGRGSFRGAHKVAPRTKLLDANRKWNPMDSFDSDKPATTSTARPIVLAPPPATSSSRVGVELTNANNDASPLPPVPLSLVGEEVPKRETIPTSGLPPQQALFMPPPSRLPARGAIRTGHDPRRGPVPSSLSATLNGNGHGQNLPPTTTTAATAVAVASPTLQNINSNVSSPLQHFQNAVSPLHAQHSPREPTNGLVSPLMEQRPRDSSSDQNTLTPADKERANEAIKAWKIDANMAKRIGHSYNFVSPQSTNPNENKEKGKDLDRVIKLTGGGRVTTILPKHRESNRTNNMVWIPNFNGTLGPLEREALTLLNFRFFYYGGAGVEEVWPPNDSKTIMYTFGALMFKLIEQCFEKKEEVAWQVEKGASVVIHPWQKVVLNHFIQSNGVEAYLKRVMPSTGNIGDKDFAIVDLGGKVLDDFEEIPSELTYSSVQGTDMPDFTSMDMEEVVFLVDKEVSRTLHRLQFEWRMKKRIFLLIMAKTRLETREVKTMYTFL